MSRPIQTVWPTFVVRSCPVALCVALVAGCGVQEFTARGTVTVDGAPLDEGTINFQPMGQSNAQSAGGAVRDGKFDLPADRRLLPGRYRVTVEGFKKTGRTVRDPQRGDVSEVIRLEFRNSPQEIDVSKENAGEIDLSLTTR